MVRIAYAAATMAALAVADVSVTEVAVPRKVSLAPAQKMMHAYRKYAAVGAVAPESLVQAAAKSPVNTTVPAESIDDDLEYLVAVQVGADTLHLDFDTGSSDLWVFSTVTDADEAVNHTLYNPSTGRLLPNATWSIQYGDGSSSSGIVYKDKVSVGAATVSNQAVEAALNVSSEFQYGASDGLLGLAMGKLNTVKPTIQATWFNNVKFSLSQRLFTADLKYEKPGTYDFGYIDDSKHTGNITYSWVNQTMGFWAFEAGPVTVGSTGPSSEPLGTVVADTGTTLIYLPDNAVETYWNQSASAVSDPFIGGYIYNCSSETLPDLQITVKNVNYTIPGEYLNAGSADFVNEGFCFGGLQSSEGLPFGLLGDVFLKSVFVVFNEVYNPRIGLAPKVL